ncbi:MAG: 2-C-methyl-D-erythritol 4-phosphate cytidylyltransferase, partial [Burkholderiales bacterium]
AGVTDEAGAIEKLGFKPKLVMGEVCNLKVTYPEDLELAALILENAWTSEERGAATGDKSQ